MYNVLRVSTAVMFDLQAVTVGLLASVGANLVEAICISHRPATDVLARATLSDLAREALSACIGRSGGSPAFEVVKIQGIKIGSLNMAEWHTLRTNNRHPKR